MKKRTLSLLLALFLILSILSACSGTAQSTATPEPAPTATIETKLAATDFTDSAGRTVAVPSQITKIAVTGPLAQIVLYALAPEMLVGIATEWDKTAEQYLPTEYYNLPVLGQLYGGKGELNLEELLAAAPDVVIDVGEPKETIVEDMDALQNQTGIPFIHITATTAGTGDAFRLLGKLLDKQEEAEKLALYCDGVYEKAVSIAGQVQKVNLLYCLGDQGINVIAKGSFHAEVIDLLANNLAVVDTPSSKGTGNEVDMEQIMMWNPDVIFFAPDSIYATVGSDPTWQKVTAVKEGRYYEVPFGPYNWIGFPPSVQRCLGMMWMAQLLYPGTAKYDLYKETAEYYKLFYHTDLTQAQYDALVANSIGKQ